MSVALSEPTGAVAGDVSPLPPLDPAHDALFLDIDGTLLDIAPTPEAVDVPESLKLSLTRVREEFGGALALVSGRTLADIDGLFAPLKFTAAGTHAGELRMKPGGPVEHGAKPLTAAEKAVFAEIAKLDAGLLLEDKIYTLAIHYRNVPALETTIIAKVHEQVEKLRADLRVLCGKLVVEVKRHGFNKGIGLRRIMAQPPFAGRRPIFLGDDVTDEDAFAVLPEFDGIGISVGRLLPGAAGMVGTPADVRAWLAGLAAPLEE